MTPTAPERKPDYFTKPPVVVIVVDSKIRDLMGLALIAVHLENMGVECHIEPLEAWRACVGAWKPDFILFNHLNAGHLADFSQHCKEWGILTGVLPNEGIFYIEGTMEYNSRKAQPHMHCDRMFCWSELHRQALIANRFCENPGHIVAVGVPRFDYYRHPWNRLYARPRPAGARPRILVNANFPLAHFMEVPPKSADDFFGQWKDIIPIYKDYWTIIKASQAGLERFPAFVKKLIETDKYDIIVRPHPRENPSFHLDWIAALTPRQRERVRFAPKDNIADLILNSDLEISCENCTTSLEAWMAGLPTVGLAFERHPFFYAPEVGGLQPECDDPDDIVGLVEKALKDPSQAEFADARNAHLEKWICMPDGCASKRTAREIVNAIATRAKPARPVLSFSERRRGMKLRLARLLGEPYHVQPSHFFKRILLGDRGHQSIRYRDYLKAVRPAEERRARELIRNIYPNS
jgi:surface carbohydrate biosynthesis protein